MPRPMIKNSPFSRRIKCNIRSIVNILPFPPPYVITVLFQKLKRRNEFCFVDYIVWGSTINEKWSEVKFTCPSEIFFLTVDRKWWGRWRFSRSEAFRVRVWYTLYAMLRHIAWTSWNRIDKKRHTRNILFALKIGYFLSSLSAFPSGRWKPWEMVSCLDKDNLSCVTCRGKIERALWVIRTELGFSGEFCDVGLSCIIYIRKSGLPLRDRIFENFRKSKYCPRFLIWVLGITHQRLSLENLWAIRKNWSCPEVLDGYRKSLSHNLTPFRMIVAHFRILTGYFFLAKKAIGGNKLFQFSIFYFLLGMGTRPEGKSA